MKIKSSLSLILVILLFAYTNSFSLPTLLSLKEIVSSNETTVSKPKLSKEEYQKLIKEIVAYFKTPEFRNQVIETIKENAKDSSSLEKKLFEVQQKNLEIKMLDIAKSYGINSQKEMNALSNEFENDTDIKALYKTLINDIYGVSIDILSDDGLLSAVPEGMKKELVDARKLMENMLAQYNSVIDKDQPIEAENNISGKLTKENFINLAQQAINYMKSTEFKAMIIKAIKKAAKNPATFDARLSEAQMNGIEAKMLEIVKPYGINSKEEMDAAGRQFEGDADVKAFNETMMNEILGVMIDIDGDSGLLKSVPKSIRKKLEESRKMMESMIAPKPQDE